MNQQEAKLHTHRYELEWWLSLPDGTTRTEFKAKFQLPGLGDGILGPDLALEREEVPNFRDELCRYYIDLWSDGSFEHGFYVKNDPSRFRVLSKGIYKMSTDRIAFAWGQNKHSVALLSKNNRELDFGPNDQGEKRCYRRSI